MSISKYLDLITSEHSDKPKFSATVETGCASFSTLQEILAALPLHFDVDTATGVQLDIIGIWVGANRRLSIPLLNVYFSWGVESVGWADGVWRDPFVSTNELVVLLDEDYRTLIKAKIATNRWDGTIDKASELWSTAFGNQSFLLITDHQDMSMGIALSGRPTTAVERAILVNKIISIIKPVGVRISEILVLPEQGPVLVWGAAESSAAAGWGSGQWPYQLTI